MITNIDAINEIIGLLIASPLNSAKTGTIDIERPINSTKEDVAVGTLPITFQQLQSGVVNVNLHVPNIKITQNGIENKRYPNRPRFKTLAPMVLSALHNKTTTNLYLTVVNSQLFVEEESSYMNFRVEVKAKNL